ncbi:MAG: hypothetical protein KAI33_01430 [Elusimicrobiales bacterium]|nr:hypothetical protein [Elusimicrobiales bacterium]
MNKNDIVRLKTSFDDIAQAVPDSNIEFWYARELMMVLGYNRWENFSKVIRKAAKSCEVVGAEVNNHFRGITKMVHLGSGAKRKIRWSYNYKTHSEERKTLPERAVSLQALINSIYQLRFCFYLIRSRVRNLLKQISDSGEGCLCF